jgi:hypothetical protein
MEVSKIVATIRKTRESSELGNGCHVSARIDIFASHCLQLLVQTEQSGRNEPSFVTMARANWEIFLWNEGLIYMIASEFKIETPTQVELWPCSSLVFEVVQVLKCSEPDWLL